MWTSSTPPRACRRANQSVAVGRCSATIAATRVLHKSLTQCLCFPTPSGQYKHIYHQCTAADRPRREVSLANRPAGEQTLNIRAHAWYMLATALFAFSDPLCCLQETNRTEVETIVPTFNMYPQRSANESKTMFAYLQFWMQSKHIGCHACAICACIFVAHCLCHQLIRELCSTLGMFAYHIRGYVLSKQSHGVQRMFKRPSNCMKAPGHSLACFCCIVESSFTISSLHITYSTGRWSASRWRSYELWASAIK